MKSETMSIKEEREDIVELIVVMEKDDVVTNPLNTSTKKNEITQSEVENVSIEECERR